MGYSKLIIVDHREKRSIVPRQLEKLGVDLKYENLTIGDYLVDNKVCVERKEINDYVSSLTSGHLHTQLYNMSTNFEVSFLIVEGIISEALMWRRIKRHQYISSLAGAAIKRSPNGKQGIIQIIPLETPFDTALFLKSLQEKIQNNEPRLPKMERVKWGTKDKLIFVASSIPNVGESRAELLLNHFKTLRNLANASWREIARIRGLGEKIAKSVENVFTTEYEGGNDGE